MAWLVNCESKDPVAKSTWLANTSTQANKNASRATLLDAIAIAKYRQDSESQIAMLATLAASGEPEMQISFLQCLRRRQVSGNPSENKNRRPLSGLQINLLLEAYDATTLEPVTLPSQSPVSVLSSMARQQMLLANLNTNRNRANLAMAMQQLATQSHTKAIDRSRPKGNEGYLRTVMNELRFAGEAEQAESFLMRQIQTAQTEFKLRSLCEYLLMSERYADVEHRTKHTPKPTYVTIGVLGCFRAIGVGRTQWLDLRQPRTGKFFAKKLSAKFRVSQSS